MTRVNVLYKESNRCRDELNKVKSYNQAWSVGNNYLFSTLAEPGCLGTKICLVGTDIGRNVRISRGPAI